MAENLPDYETLEDKILVQPTDVLRKLPDNLERRRAEEHIKIAVDYAYQSRERPADRHQ